MNSLFNNKKGQVVAAIGALGVTGTLVALVIVAIFIFILIGGGLSFITNNLFVVAGIGITIGAFIILFQGVQGEFTQTKAIIMVILFATGVFFILGAGVLQQSVGENRYSEIPAFGFVECKVSGSAKTNTFDIDKNGQWVSDNFPVNTDKWSVTISTPQDFTLTNRFVEYYICPNRNFNNCLVNERTQVERGGAELNIGSVDSDNHVWAQFQSGRQPLLIAKEGAKSRVTFTPYGLFRDDPVRGSGFIDSNSCVVPRTDNSFINRITRYIGKDNIETRESSDNRLEIGEGYNYVTGNILAVTEGNTQEGGWCIYENGRGNIYEIETVQTPTQRYNRVNLDNQVATVDCCDGSAVPGGVCQDGNFIAVEEAECTTRADCGIIEYSPSTDPNQIQRPMCVEGQCQLEFKDADCTTNAQCRTGEICDLGNSFTCISAGTDEEGRDVTDRGIEREETPDSSLDCKFYQDFVPAGTETSSFLFFEKTTETQDQCKVSPFAFIISFFLMVALIIIALVLIGRKK